MTTEAPMALRVEGCPEPEQLAAYLDGTLTPAERTDLEQHLSGCADCRDVVGGTVAAVAELPGSAVRPQVRSRTQLRWAAAAGGVLAAAAALLLVVRIYGPHSDAIPEITRLAQAVGTERVIEPRLTGGFSYGPVPSVTRGAADVSLPPPVIVAANQLKTDLASRRDADSDSARGVADLLLGDASAAIRALERAADANPDARRYADLSAAYLVRARAGGDPADLRSAISNADRAIGKDANLEEAYFNRALALEASGDRAAAAAAWRAYLARDSSSPWAQEARNHLERE